MAKKSLSKSHSKAKPMKKPLSRSLRVYQKVAVLFMLVSFVMLIGVLYLSVSKATIRVTPNERVVSTTISLEIAEDPHLDQIEGTVFQDEVTIIETFTLPEEGSTLVEGTAGGGVTLMNDSGTSQPLVATTRLLSEDGVLFRLEEGVTVPASGSIEAAVYADVAGESGDIDPTTFTIPGLNSSRQQVVYAVSESPMTGGLASVRLLTEDDLHEAAALLEAQATEDFDGSDLLFAEVIGRVSDSEPGEEVSDFTIAVTVLVTSIQFDEDAVLSSAARQLRVLIPEGYELREVNEDGMQVEIVQVDTADGTAIVSVYLDGIAVIGKSSSILEKDRLLGRAPEEVVSILESTDAIEEARVTFTPFWLKRVPTLKDHIKIIIE